MEIDNHFDDIFDDLDAMDEDSVLGLDHDGLLPSDEEIILEELPLELSDIPIPGPDQNMAPADGGLAVDGAAGGDAVAETEPLAAGDGEEASHAAPILFDDENTMPDGPVWVPYEPFWALCGGCCLIREIIHVDASRDMRLSLHGDLLVIRHATLEIHYFAKGVADENYIAEFAPFDPETVKQFLLAYSKSRIGGGQKLIQDVNYTLFDLLSENIEYAQLIFPAAAIAGFQIHSGIQQPLVAALGPQPLPPLHVPGLVGVPGAFPLPPPAFMPLAPGPAHPHVMAILDPEMEWEVVQVPEPEVAQLPEPAETSGASSSRAARRRNSGRRMRGGRRRPRRQGSQRQSAGSRAPNFEDVSRHFNVPIVEAAKRLQISTSALKKVCREHKIPRWPYRQVKSSKRKIERLRRILSSQSGTDEEADWTRSLLHAEEMKLSSLYEPRA